MHDGLLLPSLHLMIKSKKKKKKAFIFSRAELIIKILLPTKLSYSNSIERLNSLLGDCFPFRFHLRGGWERALSSAVLKRLKSAAGVVSDIVGLSVGFQIATSSGFSNQSRHAEQVMKQATAKGDGGYVIVNT